MRRGLSWLLFGVAMAACRGGGAHDAPPAEVPGAAPGAAAVTDAAPRVAADPARFDCAAAADCVNSCAYGAVSAAWYRAAETAPGFQECEDGCANQIAAPPRCEAGQCVAYQVDPHDSRRESPRPSCTRVSPRP
ncbi:MAG: hypothetical protein H6708_31760 [Kofleriaceae bacterium]|nr:hypothetical protein [Kofleriaceae bacterium]